MEIPYNVELRKDTGLYNSKLGIWLFLASEVMLFGGLFSAYILLRTGAPVWPPTIANYQCACPSLFRCLADQQNALCTNWFNRSFASEIKKRNSTRTPEVDTQVPAIELRVLVDSLHLFGFTNRQAVPTHTHTLREIHHDHSACRLATAIFLASPQTTLIRHGFPQNGQPLYPCTTDACATIAQ